jgi:hypothetical protein
VSLLALRQRDFTVHLHHLEDFLLTFHSKTAFDRVAGDHFLKDPSFTLSTRPWCKLAHANNDRLDYHVELELRGFPALSWHLSTAEHLLGSVAGSSGFIPAPVHARTSPRSAYLAARMTPRRSERRRFWRLWSSSLHTTP